MRSIICVYWYFAICRFWKNFLLLPNLQRLSLHRLMVVEGDPLELSQHPKLEFLLIDCDLEDWEDIALILQIPQLTIFSVDPVAMRMLDGPLEYPLVSLVFFLAFWTPQYLNAHIHNIPLKDDFLTIIHVYDWNYIQEIYASLTNCRYQRWRSWHNIFTGVFFCFWPKHNVQYLALSLQDFASLTIHSSTQSMSLCILSLCGIRLLLSFLEDLF